MIDRLAPFGKMAADNLAAMLKRLSPDFCFVLVFWRRGEADVEGQRLAFSLKDTPVEEVAGLLERAARAFGAADHG